MNYGIRGRRAAVCLCQCGDVSTTVGNMAQEGMPPTGQTHLLESGAWTLPSSGQMAQHSSWGMTGLGQSLVSSQMTSSHITVPLSHTQIWHGSGFHTSRSANTWPSKVQLLLRPAEGDRHVKKKTLSGIVKSGTER